MLKNTGVMCMVAVNDNSREEGFRFVDVGNLFTTDSGERVLLTSDDLAEKYSHLIDYKIYARKNKEKSC